MVVPRADATAKHIIQAIGSSSEEKGRAFAQKFGGDATPSIYGSYDAVYADPEVDIVYIGIPHAFHKDACLKAISHRKHVLCEKPFTLNEQEAQEVFDAAKKKGVFVMEGKAHVHFHFMSSRMALLNLYVAMWTRFMPLTEQLLRLVHQEKRIGDVHRVFCDFGMLMDLDSLPATSRLKDPALGAGTLLDIGVYSLTWGLLGLDEGIASAALTPQVFSAQSISEGIDVTTSIVLHYPQNGRQGILTSSMKAKSDPVFARIEGSKGTVFIEGIAPSLPRRFTVVFNDAAAERQIYDAPPKVGKGFFYEADAVANDIVAGRVENATMPWDETLRVLALMDGIRARGVGQASK
jgi:predicted dehydrogenase